MSRITTKSRTWLHLSERDLGAEFIFTPRVPETRAIEEDDKTPRICVSDTILRCLAAIDGVSTEYLGSYSGVPTRPMYIYRLKGKGYRPTNEEVPDAYKTNEHWLLVPTKGIRGRLIKQNSIKA